MPIHTCCNQEEVLSDCSYISTCKQGNHLRYNIARIYQQSLKRRETPLNLTDHDGRDSWGGGGGGAVKWTNTW